MDPSELEKFREVDEYYRLVHKARASKMSGEGGEKEPFEVDLEMGSHFGAFDLSGYTEAEIDAERRKDPSVAKIFPTITTRKPRPMVGLPGELFCGPKGVINDFAKEHNNNLHDFGHCTEEILNVLNSTNPADKDAEVMRILEKRKQEIARLKSQIDPSQYHKPKFGQARYITYHTYNYEVFFTHPSTAVTVIVFIYNKTLTTYEPMRKSIEKLATKYTSVKFVLLEADGEFVSSNFLERALPLFQVVRNNILLHTVLTADDEIGITYEELLKYFFE